MSISIFFAVSVIFLIIDCVCYTLIPYDYVLKFDKFLRRAVLGSGIYILIMYKLHKKGK